MAPGVAALVVPGTSMAPGLAALVVAATPSVAALVGAWRLVLGFSSVEDCRPQPRGRSGRSQGGTGSVFVGAVPCPVIATPPVFLAEPIPNAVARELSML